MNLTFLGTGTSTGVPVLACTCEVCKSKNPKDKRTRTSVYIEIEGIKIVIDTGPDFRSQMLREDLHDVDVILFTHAHRDHIAGFDEIRSISHILNKSIDVYADAFTTQRLRVTYDYFFEGNYPGKPQIKMNIIEDTPFWVRDKVKITPIPAMHGDSPVYGFRMENLTYLTDVNCISESSLKLMEGTKTFIISGIQKKKHYSHFSLEEALEVIQQINSPQNYITHISHHLGLQEEVSEELPEGVLLAFDGLKICG